MTDSNSNPNVLATTKRRNLFTYIKTKWGTCLAICTTIYLAFIGTIRAIDTLYGHCRDTKSVNIGLVQHFNTLFCPILDSTYKSREPSNVEKSNIRIKALYKELSLWNNMEIKDQPLFLAMHNITLYDKQRFTPQDQITFDKLSMAEKLYTWQPNGIHSAARAQLPFKIKGVPNYYPQTKVSNRLVELAREAGLNVVQDGAGAFYVLISNVNIKEGVYKNEWYEYTSFDAEGAWIGSKSQLFIQHFSNKHFGISKESVHNVSFANSTQKCMQFILDFIENDK